MPAPRHQWLEFDARLCLQLNRATRIHCLRAIFRTASRLGDGVFRYALMLALLAAVAPRRSRRYCT